LDILADFFILNRLSTEQALVNLHRLVYGDTQ
jgi:hypothetical protein